MKAGAGRGSMVALMLALLAGCGADGPPQRPSQPASTVQISGEARLGVTLE